MKINTLCLGSGDPDVTINIRRNTVGNGPVGMKTAELRRHEPIIDRAYDEKKHTGLINVPHVAITPAFFLDLMRRSGASHENPAEAMKAIDTAKFSFSESDGLREACQPFTGLWVAVRADEWTPRGMGLTHTGFVFVDGSADSFQKFEEEVKVVQKSNFSPGVIAMKKRVGVPLEENLGVLVMPVIGYKLYEEVFTTPYSVNAITFFNGDDTMLAIGPGIGGANLSARTTLFSRLATRDFHPRYGKLIALPVDGKGENEELGRTAINSLYEHEEMRGIFMDELGDSIRNFNREARTSKYLELAYEMDGGNYAVVQIGDIKLSAVEKPDVPREQKITVTSTPNKFTDFGSHALGRGVIKTETVFHLFNRIDAGPHMKETVEILGRINGELNGYALFVNAPADLFREVPFEYYSNAGAIIFCGPNRTVFCLGTHLNGAMREAGILALDGETNPGFIKGLPRNEVSNRKLLIYVNEAKEEGFVSTR